MKEKILTRKRVDKLGLDNLSVITADMLKGYTSIGDGAFEYCYSLISITIPNSVTSIGQNAFSCCKIDNIYISGTMEEWLNKSWTPGQVSYSYSLFINDVAVTNVVIPNSVTSIGNSAFSGCSSLTSVTIPNSITSIGNEAFYKCRSLTSVTIPNSVTSIGNEAFYKCSSLTSVTIGNSVTSIGDYAFSGCSGLTSIEIPNSVISIGKDAFRDCRSLTSIEIPNSVTSVRIDAFSNCNFKQKRKTDKKGRIIAYKGFNKDMTCCGFQYKEGETYELECGPLLCKRGFHACLNPLDCFAYYYGQIGKDIVFHEVYLEGVSDKKSYDSKVVAKKITIGREITISEMADIASGRK